MKRITTHYKGAVDGWMIATIGLIVLVLGIGALSIWTYMNWQEAQTNIDGKISAAVALAKKDQAEEDEAKFAEREKEPRREFIGPDDYGRLSMTYPKTWSVYVNRNAVRGGNYEAYFHPIEVPPISDNEQQFALRLFIINQDYNQYVQQFESLVREGKLRSTVASVNGENGTRLDGNFNEKIRGASVIFKIRDKTAVLRTDADTFKPDFDTLVKTITFVK